MSLGGATAVEARVRRVVADTLGVGDDDLTPEVSLADDLAADSLDLVEMAIELERELGIMLPDRVLGGVRTFGELLTTALSLTRRSHEDEVRARRRPMLVRTGVVPIRGRGERKRPALVRTEWLTPYDMETIAEDARRAGRGARLDVVLPVEAGAAEAVEIEERFSRLRDRGLGVTVHRADDAETSPAQHRRAGARGA